MILEELAKYDARGLTREDGGLVRRVNVVRSLHFSGVTAAGTTIGPEVWIAVSHPEGPALSEADIRRTVHHEIGALVFRRYFDELEDRGWPGGVWKGWDPDELFAAIKAGKTGISLDAERVRSQGILTEYASLSAEKDFATLHEFRMMSPEAVDALVPESRVLERKCSLWREFIGAAGILRQP